MEQPLTSRIRPGQPPLDIAAYEKTGGYQALRKALRTDPRELIEEVKHARLRGRGGAGFPTGMKWSFVPTGKDAPRPRYLVVNADEMEPGTFKDRLLLEGDPHLMLEGTIISAWAIQAEIAYIFLRWAYKRSELTLRKAIEEAHDRGYLGKNILDSGFDLEVHIHVSAGRYMCGEETGLLNALEGKRATPRAKPPFPPVVGLWGKPTVVNNVETLCNVPAIVSHGAQWFRDLASSDDGGTKLYGVSGRVNRPGLWELPLGTTMREVIEQHAGGMKEGYTFRGALPGGASTDFLLPEHMDVKLDFNEVQKVGSRMGTGTIIVLDDHRCPVGMVRNLERFFAQESCGWCTPCREGLPWAARTLDALEEGHGEPRDLEVLEMLSRQLAPGRTFCALAPGAVEPLQSALKYFRDDFQRHIDARVCPWRT
jgi:NADH-quinone oxidoreductase subunit F